MADTSYLVNDALTVKVWAKKLFVDALKETYADRFMGKTSSSLIHVRDELGKSAGDQITVGLRVQLTGDGKQGDDSLEGEEEALTTYHDAIVINQLRHAVRSAGKMSEQRVTFSIRDEAKAGLKDWWADRIDTWFMNQISGNTVQSDTKRTGNQAVSAASSTRIIRAGSVANDESLGASNIFELTLIDKAKELAQNASPLIRPVRVGGKDKYVMFLHGYQVTDMRINTSVGQWLDIQKAALAGGGADNPIYSGALGEYNDVILHSTTRLPLGVATAGTAVASTRRAVLCGAQAACFAYGGDNGQEMSWVEELFDYKNKLGVSAGMIAGLKKTRFNSVDFGTVVVSTYAAAHT